LARVAAEAESARLAEEARVAAEAETARAAAEAEATPVAAEAEAAAAARAFQPGVNLDDEIAAYERSHVDSPEPGAKPVEPIPTAIGQPLPASAVEVPPSWPAPGTAGTAFEPHWPDIAAARGAPDVAAPPPPPQASAAGSRRIGANLPAADVPPPPVAARACPSCGLSLSASARFCRRCGTQQQVDAPR
jgi:hypothetical protein